MIITIAFRIMIDENITEVYDAENGAPVNIEAIDPAIVFDKLEDGKWHIDPADFKQQILAAIEAKSEDDTDSAVEYDVVNVSKD